MKKKIIYVLSIIVVIFTFVISTLKNDTTNVDKITVAEVTHSVFYTPWYVAIEKGFFEEENIDIELILANGADKVSAALLSGDVQVGLAGPESSIYVFNGGEEDYLVSFAGLTKRDGQFIVGRNKDENFTLDKLYNKEVLAGRIGGMPVLNFENALKNNLIDKSKIEINTSIEFGALAGSFIAGIGDYVNLFEPNATKLEEEGLGYVVGSVGELAGEVPYTTFIVKKSYLEKENDLIKRFSKALKKGIDYTLNNNEDDLAKIISPQFPDEDLEILSKIIKRYKDADSWYNNINIPEKDFVNLENIMIDANLLEEYVPFNDLVRVIENE